jgi:hypothetical protein
MMRAVCVISSIALIKIFSSKQEKREEDVTGALNILLDGSFNIVQHILIQLYYLYRNYPN